MCWELIASIKGMDAEWRSDCIIMLRNTPELIYERMDNEQLFVFGNRPYDLNAFNYDLNRLENLLDKIIDGTVAIANLDDRSACSVDLSKLSGRIFERLQDEGLYVHEPAVNYGLESELYAVIE
jgi:hypothetical protein